MVGQSDTMWSAERSSLLHASRILCECRKVFMVGQLDTV